MTCAERNLLHDQPHLQDNEIQMCLQLQPRDTATTCKGPNILQHLDIPS